MRKRRKSIISNFECPHCGELVASNARACPHCGSDEQTGWSKDTDLQYESDDFDYDEFIANEFGERTSGGNSKRTITIAVIIALLVATILSLLPLAI